MTVKRDAPSLADRRKEIDGQIAFLRREAGKLILDGGEFGGADELARLERERDALEEALGEQVARDREREATAHATKELRLRRQIATIDSERLAAVETAEGAARRFASAAADVLKLSRSQCELVQRVGDRVPVNMHGGEPVKQLSLWLMAVLAELDQFRFGYFTLQPGWRKASDGWREQFDYLKLERSKPNGHDNRHTG